VRDIATIAAAIGIVVLLFPRWRGKEFEWARGAALLVTLLAWAGIAASLLPETSRDSLADRATSPVGAVAMLVGVTLALVVLWLLAKAVIAWPWVWFVALAIALPIRLPIAIGGESAKLLIPLYIVIGVGVAAVVLMRFRGMELILHSPARWVDPLVGALIGFIALSALWSADPEEGAIKLVFFYVPFAVLYLLVIALWKHASALRILATTTIVISVPIAALAIWQYALRGVFWNESLIQANVYSRFYRVNSIFFDPNILGRFLVVAVVAALALAWVAKDRRTILLLLGVNAILAAGLFVTFSRSSALMLMIAMAMLAWRAFGAKRTALVGGMLIALFALVSFGTSEQIRRAATSQDRLEKVSEGRFDLVQGGIEIWRDNPVAGAGLGSFADLYQESLSAREQARTRVVISHNAPVTVLAEGGLIGFGLLIALIIAVAIALIRRTRDGTAGAWFEWAMFAILVGTLVHTLLYSALFEDPYVWVVLAAALTTSALRLHLIPDDSQAPV